MADRTEPNTPLGNGSGTADPSHRTGCTCSICTGQPAKRRKGERCPSGKLMFGDERQVTRAVTRAAVRGELPPMRHYRCPLCDHWHLARKKCAPGAVPHLEESSAAPKEST